LRKGVLLTLALAFATSLCAGAQGLIAEEFTSPRVWAPERVPFSFTYGGVSSSALLRTWKPSKSKALKSAGGSTVYTYYDVEHRVRITAEVRRFRDAPDVIDYVLRVRNEGSKDTPLIENVLPLDVKTALSEASVTLRHARGSLAQAGDFAPVETRFGQGQGAHLESASGDSSSGGTLPFFNLQAGSQGLIGAIGWTGNWKADFTESADGRSLRLTAGMKKTHFVLHAGEEVRTPRIVLMHWHGGDWQEAQNAWRRVLLLHYTPQDNGAPMRGPVLSGSWGSEPIANKEAYVRWLQAHEIPVSVYAVDAGWYGNAVGAENDPTNPWWKNRGDWTPSPLYYPNGLKPLGDLLRIDKIGFSLWLEPETSVADRQIAREHPAWFLHTDHPMFTEGMPSVDVVLANLGNPAALAGITTLVSSLVAETGMTWYRQDFNIPPERYWELADAPDRVGVTEMKYVAMLYQLWDTLLQQHPGLHIDNCASGGRRLDIEMMSRSFVVWRTDHGVGDSLATQAQTQALAYWVPETMAFQTYTAAEPWTRPGPYSTPESIYGMRLGYDAGYGITPGATGVDNEPWVRWVKQAIGEYREVQPYFYGDFYPLLPYSLSADTWTAWQWNRPSRADGVVMALRRPGSQVSRMQLTLQHVDAGREYEVEVRAGYERSAVKTMRGSELSRMEVLLPEAPSSAVIFYREVGAP